MTYDPDPNKSGRNERKPATVKLDDGTVIDAAHHITNDRTQLLHLYIEERDGGIDVTVPLADSAADAWARTDIGREALGIDTADENEHDLVADGGRDAVKFAEDVDFVEYDGDGFMVYCAVTREKLEICQVNKRPITVPVDECTPTDVRGNPLNDNGERLVTDGGCDVPRCVCGADLVRTAELTTEHAPVGTSRRPRMEEVPAAECGNCGQLVGAAYGMQAVLAVWEARGESPPAASDDGDDDRDSRLLTDGGLPGDTQAIIEHDDEMWVAGKSNGEYVRLYPAGRNPNGPTVVLAENIEPNTNGGEGSW